MSRRALFALAALAIMTTTGAVHAQVFDLSWFTVDSGGGTSSGGAFTLTGTIGQHDAGGPMTGGTFSLSGGFWMGGGAIDPCGPCVADFNGSGGTPDDADVAAFFLAWNSGEPCADANDSGGTPDDADITRFFVLWNAGGC